MNKLWWGVFFSFIGFYFFKDDAFYFIARYYPNKSVTMEKLYQENIHLYQYLLSFPSQNKKIITQLYGDYIIIKKTSLPLNTAVLGKQGVIGKIISGTPYTQKVQLITNINSQIPVYIKNFGKAILKGQGHNKLKLEYIYPFSSSKKPIKGDVVYVLGIDGVFPKHKPIAIIKNVQDIKNMTCVPYENIDLLEYVICMDVH